MCQTPTDGTMRGLQHNSVSQIKVGNRSNGVGSDKE